MSKIVVEPYNAVLSAAKSLELLDVDFLFDNESVFKITQKNLDMFKPSYYDLNRLIAQVVSSITASLRFPVKRSLFNLIMS